MASQSLQKRVKAVSVFGKMPEVFVSCYKKRSVKRFKRNKILEELSEHEHPNTYKGAVNTWDI